MSPSSSEQEALGLAQNKSQVLVRQIFLCDADTALVYGRVTVSALSYTQAVAPQHKLYQSTVAQLSQPLNVPLWARRSLFQ
jgi:chorismate-pyruvate lyase